MPHLLRIHIGPVQDLIAAARRSRDLWYGSWMLSELSKAATLGITRGDPGGVDALIFPAPTNLDELRPGVSDLNVANEIVALINSDPAKAVAAARKAIDNRRAELIRDAFGNGPDSLRKRLEQQGTWAVAEAQLNEFIEFYWAAVPYTSDYPADRALADRLLAARKNTRTFTSVDWGRERPKSSLDGARESVIPEDDAGDEQLIYEKYRARRGEKLSGVDLLKRLGNAGNESRFPSTSHMAAMPLLVKLAKLDPAHPAWKAYLGTLPGRVKIMEKAYHDLRLPLLGDLDGSLLFASRLLDHLEGAALKTAETKLHDFFENTNIPKPIPYYALLVGDGDNMGRAIQSLPTPGANRTFSRDLAGFAAEARQIVQQNDGATIYAGGDDVLALLPLHTAISCAAALAQKFAERMAGYAGDEGAPTFSAGLAIVHHLEPLEDALNLGRDAEKVAKAVPGKNALAVILDKRSGTPRAVAGKWGALDRRLLNLADLHDRDLIPDRLAYQLLDVWHRLGGESAHAAGDILRKVLELEAERIIDRKRAAGGQDPVTADHKAAVRQLLADNETSIAAAANELIIAALLADVSKLAETPYTFAPEEEAIP